MASQREYAMCASSRPGSDTNKSDQLLLCLFFKTLVLKVFNKFSKTVILPETKRCCKMVFDKQPLLLFKKYTTNQGHKMCKSM